MDQSKTDYDGHNVQIPLTCCQHQHSRNVTIKHSWDGRKNIGDHWMSCDTSCIFIEYVHRFNENTRRSPNHIVCDHSLVTPLTSEVVFGWLLLIRLLLLLLIRLLLILLLIRLLLHLFIHLCVLCLLLLLLLL